MEVKIRGRQVDSKEIGGPRRRSELSVKPAATESLRLTNE